MTRSLVVLACGLSACGVIPGTQTAGSSSCKYASAHACQDDLKQSQLTLQTLMTSCPMGGGVYSTSLCDRTGSIGGCNIDESAVMAGASIVTWYFAGAHGGDGGVLNTTADVMAYCPNQGDTSFVSP